MNGTQTHEYTQRTTVQNNANEPTDRTTTKITRHNPHTINFLTMNERTHISDKLQTYNNALNIRPDNGCFAWINTWLPGVPDVPGVCVCVGVGPKC